MNPIFASQFADMQAAFATEGGIRAALAPDGTVDYIYAEGLLLAVDHPGVRSLLDRALGYSPMVDDTASVVDGLVVLRLNPGTSVPAALDAIDGHLAANPRLAAELAQAAVGAGPWVTPVHVLHITGIADAAAAGAPGVVIDLGRLCPAGEPVPHNPPSVPAESSSRNGGNGVLIGFCDTGLLGGLSRAPWLAGAAGEPDPLGKKQSDGLPAIPRYCGHGTFVAGVARCEAPMSQVYVANTVGNVGGGVYEHVVAARVKEMIGSDPALKVINLSLGGYTRQDQALLSFTGLTELRDGTVTLVAAAGNDNKTRKFWPAAFDWAIGVGALDAAQRKRAKFSNHGDWVDVYAVGEGMVNAYATGWYTYREPPLPNQSTVKFDGIARWQGTSFATPVVAGRIATETARRNLDVAAATKAVLAQARKDAISGVGPVVRPAP